MNGTVILNNRKEREKYTVERSDSVRGTGSLDLSEAFVPLV